MVCSLIMPPVVFMQSLIGFGFTVSLLIIYLFAFASLAIWFVVSMNLFTAGFTTASVYITLPINPVRLSAVAPMISPAVIKSGSFQLFFPFSTILKMPSPLFCTRPSLGQCFSDFLGVWADLARFGVGFPGQHP